MLWLCSALPAALNHMFKQSLGTLNLKNYFSGSYGKLVFSREILIRMGLSFYKIVQQFCSLMRMQLLNYLGV